MQKHVVLFPTCAFLPPGFLWHLPGGLRHVSSLTCQHLSLFALLMVFHPFQTCPLPLLKWSSSCWKNWSFLFFSVEGGGTQPSGAETLGGGTEEKQPQGQQPSRSLALVAAGPVTIPTATTTGDPDAGHPSRRTLFLALGPFDGSSLRCLCPAPVTLGCSSEKGQMWERKFWN